MKKVTLLSSLIPVLLLSGCSQIPSYQKPVTELPSDKAWQQAKPMTPLTLAADEKTWWQALTGDAALQTLIDEALLHNSDIALAKLNLQQAQLLLKQSQSAQFPELSVNSELARTRSSDEAYPVGTGATFGNFSLGGLLSYEVDLWGRVDALNKQAEANFKATQADQKTIQLTVTAAVAQAYLNLMAFNQNVMIAQETVQSRTETLQLRQTQLAFGSVTPLTVHQAESELAAVQIALHQKQEQRDLQLHALAVLVGKSPKALTDMANQNLSTQPLTEYDSLPVPNALPSDLLERRPDILAMEQRLIAANANIGVAKASLFPSISLTGLLGFQSEALSRLFDGDSLTWNAGAAINAPIFDYGKRQSQVQISQAQQQAMVINYQQTIRTAFKEVLDALTQLEASAQQLDAQKRQVVALNQILDLSQKRFDAGYSSYLEVLDAQRNLFNAELAQVSMMLSHSSALVNLYKALGGSWKPEQKQGKT
ncbi:MAG: efflux transporter outer membrane subunit [Thiotrichales bacterium]|nr:efflux transporter outer membrane subunit [Thiotrichales bacterium]